MAPSEPDNRGLLARWLGRFWGSQSMWRFWLFGLLALFSISSSRARGAEKRLSSAAPPPMLILWGKWADVFFNLSGYTHTHAACWERSAPFFPLQRSGSNGARAFWAGGGPDTAGLAE